ncbi:hypothetical protein R3X27_17515 [Tropicimonas sp. TH_r6]|uniref:hypothetical protein n=1 Tax=Tropicimonas sp. TH_r6 TaxID=3082085 RepID=UPI002952E559|nr:hypothetical protein [Tropicimonas sp. TH_r6]MDV7144479.1 hypothetical protein [Tropicimonas sp. TH_r6]
MSLRGACLGLCLSASATFGEPVHPADYDQLARELSEVIDFERLPQRPEPGFNLDNRFYARGAWLGEHFAGQQITADAAGHDRLTDPAPAGWLSIASGEPGRNLSIAFHRGFGSNALFPLGATGFPALEARGEGAVALLFDHDQTALGFRIHTDYPDPLGARPAPEGQLEVSFFARNGALLARLEQTPGPGISAFGYRHIGGGDGIAGLVIVNTDPGGIAIDDIIFAKPPLLG